MDSLAPLALEGDKVGVTDFAKGLLASDPRTGYEREFHLRGKDTKVTFGGILATWRDYIDDDNYASMWVVYGGELRLVHRKEARVGFTPFAKEHLLYPSGHAMDFKNRPYILGGHADGKRVRREIRATILVVWLDYASDPNLTHMWVQWPDGKRHLVHRKGL